MRLFQGRTAVRGTKWGRRFHGPGARDTLEIGISSKALTQTGRSMSTICHATEKTRKGAPNPAALTADSRRPTAPLLLQLDIPVRPVEELAPRRVTAVGEFDVYDGISPRFDGLANQVHRRLMRGPAALTHVALMTSADHVLPRGRSALRARNHMVQAQIASRKPLATVLACIDVAGEYVAAIELDVLPRQLRIAQDTNDSGDHEIKPHGANPIVIGRLELALEGAERGPIVEVVGNVSAVFNMHDLRDRPLLVIALEQEGEGPPDTNHTQGRIVSVEK